MCTEIILWPSPPGQTYSYFASVFRNIHPCMPEECGYMLEESGYMLENWVCVGNVISW